MSAIITNMAKAKQMGAKDIHAVKPLTMCECNGIRYMAGYVAVKLLKKFRKRSKNAAIQLKRRLFVKTLESMKAFEQPGEPDSLTEYTSLWIELIDRGGLYRINNNVYNLIVTIDMLLRSHFNVANIQTYIPGTDLRRLVMDEIMSSENIVTKWEEVASGIPPRYEKYSVELLRIVCDLWITIRGNSFAKGWTQKFERKYKKGTRKTLLPEREDK